MAAISDSSPLILFSRIGRLDLLHAVFRQVFVPPAVWREVVIDGEGRAGANEVRGASWLRRLPLPSAPMANTVSDLDPGEAETLHLAASMPVESRTVLLDDYRARLVAHGLGLVVIGSRGVLRRAKEAQLIPEVRPLLIGLRDAGLFLSDETLARLLRRVGEG